MKLQPQLIANLVRDGLIQDEFNDFGSSLQCCQVCTTTHCSAERPAVCATPTWAKFHCLQSVYTHDPVQQQPETNPSCLPCLGQVQLADSCCSGQEGLDVKVALADQRGLVHRTWRIRTQLGGSAAATATARQATRVPGGLRRATSKRWSNKAESM